MSGLGFTHWGTLVAITFGVSFCTIDYANAQITPDGTLPNNSIVTPDGNTLNITGGTQAGSNLFHSFGEFSVPIGGTASFNNALDIQNIISRVTGGSVSNIDGIISTLGTANLFLINPNGIIFGQNAQLNIGGSFVATTASAISFGNQGFFSASNPETSPSLLTINPSALLFNQIQTASIQNNSVAPSGLNPSSEFIATGLRVPDGKSLLLVGGDINMDGGGLFGFGGRIDLGGSSSAGTIGLNLYGDNLSLNFPNSLERSDVFLSNGARVVTTGDGGSITVNAQDVQIIGRTADGQIGSGLFANADLNSTENAGDLTIKTNTLLIKDGAQVSVNTLGAGKGGNLSVDAQDVQIIGISADGQYASALSASADRDSTGDAGDLTIKTNTLLLKDGAQVGAGTLSVGKGGNLSVDAQDVQIIGISADGRISSGLFANADLNSTGDAGDLTIKTNTLLIKDGAQVATGTLGVGKGGDLRVDAQDVQIIGESADGRIASGLSAQADNINLTGDAGDLTIKTNTLLIKDGAGVSVSTFGAGKGGDLRVDAQDVQIIGRSADGQYASNLSASADSTGDAGNLTIKTNTLLIKDGAQVTASTFDAGKGGDLRVDAQDVQIIGRTQVNAGTSGAGKGGNLSIKTNTLLIKDGAQVNASTFDAGKGGDLRVDAQDVQIIGETADGRFGSVLSASAQPNSTGDAGDLTIKTNTLLVKDGAQVDTGTFGAGKGGDLRVDAQNVQIIGRSADGQYASDLSASADRDSTGDAGDLTIKTNTLLIKDGAQVNAGTSGAGKGGDLRVDAQDVQIIGTNSNGQYASALSASTNLNSTGDAGDLAIKTNSLLVQDGAGITVQSLGTGIAGNLTIDAPSIRLDNNALLSGNTQSAKVDPNREQATININSKILTMSRNSNIRTNARGENVIGGNINIDTDFLIAFKNSDISANSTNFRGGNVRINAQGIFGTQFRDVPSDSTSDITATGASPEFSGSVELNTPDVDPNSGLVALPTVAVDTQIAQGCYSPGYAQNSFIITGRGGLPPNPREAFSANIVRPEWATLGPSNDINSQQTIKEKPPISPPPAPIVEATGWELILKVR
ncbi:MAG: filamentous hemagglutinin N-terminal domain-containing protein [Nostoc indistinguendum CM1-VF10]|nr:filamentous hemagglutinin N-terminal domain-containing protein [Nostoc indistinguendum CM1-VF10]